MGRALPSPHSSAHVLETVIDPDVHPPPCRGRQGGLSASRWLSAACSHQPEVVCIHIYIFSPLLIIYLGGHFRSQRWNLNKTKWRSLCWTVRNTVTFKTHLILIHISEIKRKNPFLSASNIRCYIFLTSLLFHESWSIEEYLWFVFVLVIHMHLFYSCLQTK